MILPTKPHQIVQVIPAPGSPTLDVVYVPFLEWDEFSATFADPMLSIEDFEPDFLPLFFRGLFSGWLRYLHFPHLIRFCLC